MVNRKVLPEEFLEKVLEDYTLEALMEMNDLEPFTVLSLLINEGLIDVEDLYFEMEFPDDD